jgi:molybdopterin synthase catalytic subunit/molybdopterin converting factor small subunit
MRVHVVAFAALREALGASRITLELGPGATAAHLRAALAREHPRWRDLIAACRVAQETDFIGDGTPLRDEDTVVLIPPVSGGSPRPEVLLTAEPLDGNALRKSVARDAAGAVVLFEGTVRAQSEGRAVRHLEYEAYEAMATAMMERIVAEARERWPVEAIHLHHRLGRLEIGEVSVVAVVSTPHRPDAFAACRHLIERLKADVPIWKKEVFADGTVWVGAPGECAHDGEAGARDPGPRG